MADTPDMGHDGVPKVKVATTTDGGATDNWSAIKDPGLEKALNAAKVTPKSAEAKAILKTYEARLDPGHDGSVDSWNGKGMNPSEGGTFAHLFDTGLVDGKTSAEMQGILTANMLKRYGPEGAKALVQGKPAVPLSQQQAQA